MPVLTSKYPGTCTRCGGRYKKGDKIHYIPKNVTHVSCYKPSVRYRQSGDTIHIRFDYDKSLVEQVKVIPHAKWDAPRKTWVVPDSPEAKFFLADNDAEFAGDDKEIYIPKSLRLAENVKVRGYPKLMKHQAIAVNTILDGNKKIYIAIPPGGGKTAIALISAKKDKAFPMLVVCPAIVKENWRREAEKWIKKDAEILFSKTPYAYSGDIIIINYDILDDWKHDLKGFKSVVFDESHYLKNPTAKRTKAGQYVADQADMLLYLSGSPTPSSPYDLVSSLESLGVLDLFGGKKSYVNRYCPPFIDRWGNTSHSKHRNLPELRENLTNSCFLSWRKDDILDLPPLQEVDVVLDSGTSVFTSMAKEMKSATITEAQRVLAKMDNEEMTQAFSKARSDVGKSKIADTVSKAEDLLADGEQVVVVTHHREVNDSLVKKLKKHKVGQIIGGMNDKQKVIDDFVDGKTRVLVMSITAGGIGINLQSSSLMVMAEIPATYSEYDQAISRQHRQGQRDNVVVYRMITPGTTDDILLKILDRKEKLHAGITEGKIVTDTGFKMAFAEYLVELKKSL